MNIYKEQDKNVRKTWMLMAGFLVVVIFIGWVFSWIYESPVILIVAVGLSIVMNFFSYWYSDKMVLKMSKAREVKREEYRELWDVTENLCISVGLPMPKLYIIDDPSPNAFATGRNKDNAVVAVTSGLLQILDRSELEGVVAHELAHIGNRDILLQTVVVTLVGLIVILADIFLRMTLWGGGGRDRGNIFILLIGLALAILAPIFATIIKLAISRKREFLADATAALMTRYPDGLARALEKISSNPRPLRTANDATAHMFISNPFGREKKRFFHKLFMTHPPVEERIKALLGK